MHLFALIFLVACPSIAYSEATNHSSPSAYPDINNILLLVSGLTQQVEELTKYREKDLKVITSLEATIDLVQQKYQRIVEENRSFRSRIENLEKYHQSEGQNAVRESSTVEDFDGNNITTDRFSVHKASPDRPGKENKTAPGTFKASKTVDRRSQHHTLRVDAAIDVVFYAYLSTSIVEPGDAYTVKFDHVVTNTGNKYNPVTGAFTCPINGLYFFNWIIGRENTGYIHSVLRKNGAAIAYSMTADDHYATDSSHTSVLVLSKGDVITVALKSHSPSPMLWQLHTSFTGFLIR